MPDLSIDSRVTCSPDLVAANMDGETVMMSLERGAYFGLGGIGSRVWELLAEPQSLRQLTQVLCDEYEVDPAVCEADVQRFAQALMQNGLINVV
jgi:hypothetical protein